MPSKHWIFHHKHQDKHRMCVCRILKERRHCRVFVLDSLKHIRWLWPIYFSVEMNPPTKITSGAKFCWYQNFFKGQLLGKWVWAFQRHKNQAPPRALSLIWGFPSMEQTVKNLIFHFKTIKPCCENLSINNFHQQGCSCICLKEKCETIFEIDAHLQNLQWFQCANAL